MVDGGNEGISEVCYVRRRHIVEGSVLDKSYCGYCRLGRSRTTIFGSSWNLN